MKNKTLTLFISLSLISTSVPAYAEAENLPCDSFIGLRLQQTCCINVGLKPPLLNASSEQFLLSIDGENLRAASFDQIKKKLSGPVGSTVNVEIGYITGDSEVLNIVRQPPTMRHGDTNLVLISGLNDRQRNVSLSIGKLIESASLNSDLIAVSQCKRVIQDKKHLANDLVNTYMNCMLTSQAIGDFGSADTYLELALKSMRSESPAPHSRFREKAAVQNLILLGKYEEAEAICKYLLLPNPAKHPRLPAAITVMDMYALIPTKSAQENLRELARNIVSGKHPQVVGFHQDMYWFAQYLESLGWRDEAFNVYTRQVETLRKQSLDTNLLGMQPIMFGLYSKARLESLSSKRELALNDLDAISTVYKKMSLRNQTLINRIPEYFPTIADIENAKRALQKGNPIAAAPKINCFSNQDTYITFGGSTEFKQQFQNTQKCFAMIKSNNKTEAQKISSELLEAYRRSAAIRSYQLTRQNLFCTCLRIARALADKGWYDASNRLLVQLEDAARAKVPQISLNDIAWTMIDAEKVHNAKCAGTKVNWILLEVDPDAGSRRLSLSYPERLCILATAYNRIDDSKRAKFFMGQSIGELKNSSLAPNRQASFFVEAATNYAKLSDLPNANNYLDQGLRLNFSLNDSMTDRLLDLATVYSENGNTSKVILAFEIALGKSGSGNSPSDIEKIRVRLAELYRKNGQSDKALSTIEAVLAQTKNVALIEEHIMAAELCEQKKNYKDAAWHYYQAGKWNGSDTNKRKKYLLGKALECASKIFDFDKTILSKIYLASGESVERTNPSEGLALREKAVAIMGDSDPDKAKQLSIISYIKGTLNKTKGEKIDSVMKAAELAHKNKSIEESDYWVRVAQAEAEANKIDSAIVSIRKAIAAYQPINAKSPMYSMLLTSSVPSLIAKAEWPKKSDILMKEALARVQSVAGVQSLPSQIQMAHNFEYLALYRKDYAGAEKVLDTFLNTNLKLGQYAPPNHDVTSCRFGGGPYPVESTFEIIRMSLLDTVKQMVANKANQQAFRFFDKIQNAQQSQFGKTDYRVGFTYAQIARAHSSAGDISKAHQAYTKAVEIMHKHEGMVFVVSNLHPDYYNVLRKLDLQSEIDRLEKIKLVERKDSQRMLYYRRAK